MPSTVVLAPQYSRAKPEALSQPLPLIHQDSSHVSTIEGAADGCGDGFGSELDDSSWACLIYICANRSCEGRHVYPSIT